MRRRNIATFLTLAKKNEIESCIADIEKKTSAEIKLLVVQSSRPLRFIPRISEKDKEKDVLRRAKEEYHKLGIGNTQEDTGILIMISLAEEMVWVLAGEAINRKIPQDRWPTMVNTIITGIRSGFAGKSICVALQSISGILQEHFPVKPDDVNEICNSVVIKK